MKNFYTFLILLLAGFALSTQAIANNVIVKGYVTYTNGSAAANRPVIIAVDSTGTSTTCFQTKSTHTNNNGFYVDTLKCSTNGILLVRVTTPDCNGNYLVKTLQVPPTNVIEANFVICQASGNSCVSNFSYNITPNSLTVLFNSSASHPGNTTDSIIRRIWTWGDGTTMDGNVISPTKTFQQPGVYNVCLKIKTASGCEKTICKTFTLFTSTPPPAPCTPHFTMSSSASNYKTFSFNSSNSNAAAGDSIISRTWRFGNGDSLTGNVVNPTYTYQNDGVYNVCLYLTTSRGSSCVICKVVEVRKPVCHSKFTWSLLSSGSVNGSYAVKFNSNQSAAAPGSQIVERIWIFGDSSKLMGNNIEPVKYYTQPGNYNVCLIIRTSNGCSDTSCATIQVPPYQNTLCEPRFNFVPTGNTVSFNSSISTAIAGDSIISRTWTFGNGVTLGGNVINPVHTYQIAGIYTVCLKIKTAKGCERSFCKQVVTANTTAAACVSRFEFVRVAPKKVQFHSNMSWVPTNDTIVERKWDFGDGSPILGGNNVSPIKDYNVNGIYTACLTIRTVKGCINKFCMPVKVQDSSAITNLAPIRIVSLFPAPVTTQMTTVVWSMHNNVNANLAIYDIYGVKKWEVNKVLLNGNNITVIPTGALAAGPYFFRVTTQFGVQSRQFYKL